MKHIWTVVGPKGSAHGLFFSREAARAAAKRLGGGFRAAPINSVKG